MMNTYVFDNEGKFMILKGKSDRMYKVYYGYDVYYDRNKFYFVKKGVFCMCRKWEKTQKCEHFDLINGLM